MDAYTKKVFRDVKKAYTDCREAERVKIKKHLKGKGFTVWSGDKEGKGIPRYTSGGRLAPAFYLSNWKWLEALDEERYYFISLQAFDRDPNSQNYHVLMDRLGLFIGKRIPLTPEERAEAKRRARREDKIRDEEIKLEINKNYEYYREAISLHMITTPIELPMGKALFRELDKLLGKA